MDIVTARLTLHALTPEEARRIVQHSPNQEDRWHRDYPLPDELEPLSGLAVATDPDELFTLYAIRTTFDGTSIGGIGFFGPPTREDSATNGSVEVGYGLVPTVRGRGFATEALVALSRFGLEHGASSVRAETALDNLASQKVLTTARFREVSRSTTKCFFQLDHNTQP